MEAFGLPWWFDVSNLEPDVGCLLAHLWRRASPADPVGPEADRVVITLDPDRWGEPGVIRVSAVPEVVPYAVSQAFTLMAIRRRAGSALMVHAAGLATPDGRVAAFIGPSGTGKTTAGQRLGKHLGYVTDETVVIERDLRVSAYTKPLSLLDRHSSVGKQELSPDDLGLAEAPRSLTLGAMVLLERDPTLDAPRIEPVDLMDAAWAVLAETSSFAALDSPWALLLTALTAGGGPYRLHYADIDDCWELVAELLDGRHDRPMRPWRHVPGGEPPALVTAAGPRPSPGDDPDPAPPPAWTEFTSTPPPKAHLDLVVVRGPFQDAAVLDHEALVLRRELPIHLEGLAAMLWEWCGAPARLRDMRDDAVVLLGPHPDSETLLLQAAQTLLDAYLIVAESETHPSLHSG